MTDFTDAQLERYSRHIILQEVGLAGQEKILQAKVLIVGAGGLGCPAALYLAAAGLGTIGIADSDTVDISNLQRQIAHFTEDIKRAKVDSAAEKMRAINSDISVKTHRIHLCAANIEEIIAEYDFVIDGSDNFATKFLINDACILAEIPFSHGGILRFEGQTMTVLPGKSACYRCAFPKPPPPDIVPTCSQVGVLGAIAGMLGTIQAAEALKYVLGVGEALTDTLLTFDAKTMDFQKVRLKRQKSCRVCGENPIITELCDEEPVPCQRE
ncbi:MAG: HesA/MoeB/ThiF family protein [Desulfobulbales bacterium]|nr:HesA/MoeB/ThiF family protein [Desulfobulbales bacterium]